MDNAMIGHVLNLIYKHCYTEITLNDIYNHYKNPKDDVVSEQVIMDVDYSLKKLVELNLVEEIIYISDSKTTLTDYSITEKGIDVVLNGGYKKLKEELEELKEKIRKIEKLIG